jgi:hypothetical protein
MAYYIGSYWYPLDFSTRMAYYIGSYWYPLDFLTHMAYYIGPYWYLLDLMSRMASYVEFSMSDGQDLWMNIPLSVCSFHQISSGTKVRNQIPVSYIVKFREHASDIRIGL